MDRRDHHPDSADLRDKIIGLGERSFRKSYYPELQERLADLQRYKTLLDQSNDVIFLINVPSGRFLDVSKSALGQIGFSEDEWGFMTMFDLLPGNHGDLAGLFSGKAESVVLDTTIRKRSGELTPYEVNMRRVRSGGNDYVVAVARDITDRKHAEEALRKSEEKFRLLADCSPIPIASYDAGERITYLNKKFTGTFGYTTEDIPDLSRWWSLAYPDQAYRDEVRERWARHVKEAVENLKEIETMEASVTCKDGSVCSVEFYGTPIGDQMMVMLHDITERKRAENDLRRTEERMRLFFERQLVGMAITSPEKGWLQVNDKLCRMLGYSRDELSAMTWDVLTHPADLPADIAMFDRLVAGKIDEYTLEKRFIRKDGSEIFTIISIGCVRKADGSLDYILALIEDVTQRKQAEEKLRLTQFAVDHFPDSSIWLDQEGRITYANDAACRAVGYGRDEMLSMHLWDIDPNFPPERFTEIWHHWLDLSRRKIRTQFESVHRTRKGKLYPVEVVGEFFSFGGTQYMVTFDRDITARKRSEEELRVAKARTELYLDLMGHDISNMNHALLGYLELIAASGTSGVIESDLISSSLDIINRSSRMIDEVKKLTLLQKGEIAAEDVDLGQVLAAVMAGASRPPGRQVTIMYEPRPDRRFLVRCSDLLRDVFENLVENAIKHSIGPLTITISVDSLTIGGDHFYRVAVEDTGPGIPDDLKKTIFTSLKAFEKKTARRGFGLYFVRTVVDHYHGQAWVEDRVPGDYRAGSKFVLLLPASGPPDPEKPMAQTGA